MAQLITILMGQLKADKGRDLNRTAVLVGVIFLCWKTDSIDKRLTVVEEAHRPRPTHVQSPSTNDFATVGPEWPKKAGATWRE